MSTQNTAPDFGEPWSPAFRNSARTANGYDHGFMDSFQKRAIECVNACAGMQDPAAEIEAMRAAIREAHGSLKELIEAFEDMSFHMRGHYTEASEFADFPKAASALAKLKPFMP